MFKLSTAFQIAIKKIHSFQLTNWQIDDFNHQHFYFHFHTRKMFEYFMINTQKKYLISLRVCYCVPDFHGEKCEYQYDECQIGPR